MPIHIEAEKKDLAPVVLLVGNPQRAQYIASTYLENSVLYNDYRLMYGYTGEYEGKKISIQTTGMGSPSVSIIIEELKQLDVKTLVRMGTCGAVRDSITVSETILVTASHSSHHIFAREFPGASFSASPDFLLTKELYDTFTAQSIPLHPGPVLCSETFYEESFDMYKKFASYNTLAVEMETYPLFALSSKLGLKSACVLTVSDLIFKSIRADKEAIKKGVDTMTSAVLHTLAGTYDYISE